MIRSEEVGGIPINTAGATNVVITAATFLVLPTAAQRKSKIGVLQCTVTFETQSARCLWNGVAPTITTGLLLTAPATLILRGERLIAAAQFISVVAGGVMNYQFTVGDVG